MWALQDAGEGSDTVDEGLLEARQLRSEQDREYMQSLQADREKVCNLPLLCTMTRNDKSHLVFMYMHRLLKQLKNMKRLKKRREKPRKGAELDRR